MTVKMTRGSRQAVLLTAVLLVEFGHVAWADCVFPKFLQSSGDYLQWLYNLTEAGTTNWDTRMHYITVTDGLMSARIDGLSNYKRSCLRDQGNNTFIVSYELAGQKPKFSCIQFIERSPAVVSMNESAFSDMEEDAACSDLTLNERPLVLYPGDYYEDCPSLGGYHMQVFNQDESIQCDQILETPRLEVSCDDTSAMYFDFKSCFVKRLVHGMRGGFTRKLYCTGSWTQGPYTFHILSRKDLANYWCFRYPTDHKNTFEAYLFSDLVCETNPEISQSKTYAKLSLHKSVVQNVCDDASVDCKSKAEKYTCKDEAGLALGGIYCKRSCFNCDPEGNDMKCDFGTINTTWKTLGPLSDIVLNDTTVMIQPMGIFDCAEKKHDNEKSHVIVRYQDNGCFPQSYCFSFKQVAPSVGVYKLVKGPDWPQYYGSSVVCSDHDNYNREFPYFTRHWTPAVLSGDLQVVPCRLPAQSYTFHAKYPDGVTCQGRLHKPDCGRNESTNLVIDSTSCSRDEKEGALRYTCLADVPNHSETGRFLFVKEWGPKKRLLCFYINYHMTLMVILPGDKCYSKARHIYSLGDFRFHKDEESNPCSTKRAEDEKIMAEVNEGAGKGLEDIREVSAEDAQTKKSNNLFSWLSSGTSTKPSFLLNLLMVAVLCK